LFATTTTGAGPRRSRRASLASSSVIPVVTSTTRTTTSADDVARAACSPASASIPPGAGRYPAVSINPNVRPSQVASTSIQSRVTPGLS
jgi:hypothetical protein